MSKQYYLSLGKDRIFSEPHAYAWNCVLYFYQLSAEELITHRKYVDIQTLVKHQIVATYDFVRTHFIDEVDEDDLLTWADVKKFTEGRG
jgi:hypothetical protein